MLKVCKRSGNLENFSHQKLKTSLINTGHDMNLSLNQAEIDVLVDDIEKKLISIRGADGVTSSYEIRGAVLSVLRNMGFPRLARTYYENRFD